MFVLTRPALTVISHCWPPTAWTGLADGKITKKNSRKNSFLIKIFEKFALLKKMYYSCSQSYEDSRIRQSECNATLIPLGVRIEQ